MSTTIVARDRAHLLELIADELNNKGAQCDLNHIDVSGVTDMSNLFCYSPFNGNMSQWDVSRVTSMRSMFLRSPFNGDLSSWNTSSVKHMEGMFDESHFMGDIARWNVSSVIDMACMFFNSKFNGDISRWDVSAVDNMEYMFLDNVVFEGNLAQWDMAQVKSVKGMFCGASSAPDVSAWTLSSSVIIHDIFERSGPALSRQTPCLWNIPLFLASGLQPKDPVWAKAFACVVPMAKTLGLAPKECAALIVEEHRAQQGRHDTFVLPRDLEDDTF